MIAAAVGIAAVWFGACWRLHLLRQWHHEYIGMACMALPWTAARAVGLGVMLDDAVQHAVQLWRPSYLSPLHRLNDFVWVHI